MFPVIARSCGICREEGYVEVGEREDGCGGESSRYRDGSCANVVAWRCTCALLLADVLVVLDCRHCAVCDAVSRAGEAEKSYLMVLLVLRRIH
jgi:hypothetical protein